LKAAKGANVAMTGVGKAGKALPAVKAQVLGAPEQQELAL